MKKICGLLLMTLHLFCAFSVDASLSELGDICLYLAPDSQFEGTSAILRVGVLSYGSGHFALHGNITTADFVIDKQNGVMYHRI